MNRLSAAPLGSAHVAVSFDQIQSAGGIQYAYLVGVFDNATKQPVYFVSSEVNSMAELGGGSHFLCVFNGDTHANCGSSDDWGDAEKFFARAMSMVEEKFGDPAAAEAVPESVPETAADAKTAKPVGVSGLKKAVSRFWSKKEKGQST
jgi:hypothetical protein